MGADMWRNFRIVVACMLILGMSLLSQQVLAQVTSAGTVQGVVTDSVGAVMPGVSVTATQISTAVQWHTVTDANGSYIFPDLPVGVFTISAAKTGFSKTEVSSVILNAGQNLRTNLTLHVGTVSQTVNVVSSSIVPDTQTGNVGEVVGSRQIEALPLVTRNFVQLIELVPGVSSDIGSEPGFASNSILAASVNGVREDSNNWTIDGSTDLDVYNGNNNIAPDIDAIAQFRIDRGNYTAEQGRSAGASINVILKSGTNQFHGSAFEFLRNAALNANNYFNNLYDVPKPSDNYNNWGYTVGGPIKKNRLFFFWSEEWRHIKEPSGTYLAKLPTANERTGNFSDYATLGVTQPLVPASVATNPLCVGCVAGQPFPNNQIPTELLNSNSLLLINDYYPTAGPIVNGYNFASAAPDITTVREELIRLDYNLNANWKAFAHYVQDQNHITSPYSLFDYNVIPYVAGSTEFEPMQNFAVNVTGSITPNLVNETQFSLYHNIIRISINPTASRSVAPGLDIPYYFPNHFNASDRIPSLNFVQYSGLLAEWPFLNGFFYHTFTDNLSWHHGNHNFKIGGLLTYQGKNEDNSNSLTNGSFTFTGTQTTNDMADMLLGYAQSYSENETDPTQHLRYWDAEAYAQDQWQVNNRLSVTYGLRETYFGPPIDENNLDSNFIPGLYQPALAPTVNSDGTLSNIPPSQLYQGAYLPTNGIIVAGQNSPYGSAVYKVFKVNLAPRAGFSYDVFGDGKTVVRGGFGRYFDRVPPFELGAKSNPPFNSSVTLYNVLVNNPRGSGGSSVYSPVAVNSFATKYNWPYNYQWSFGIQRQVIRNIMVDAEYVETLGEHLLYTPEVNANPPSVAVASGAINVNQARPYLGYGAIGQLTPEASSNYHGLQVAIQGQPRPSLTFNVSYTYSRTLTDASNEQYSPQNNLDPHADYGPASFDKPQMLVASYEWQLPFFASNEHAVVREALAGWQWGGILSTDSGEPLTVANDTFLPSGTTASGVVDSTQRPDQIGKVQAGNGINDWLNLNAFAAPPLGQFGTEGVGVARLPKFVQFDTSVQKNFHLYRQVAMNFRVEAINALNHTNFNGVDTNYYATSPTFGHITSANLPRITQIGLHFVF